MTFLKPLIDRASLKKGRALIRGLSRDNDGQLGVSKNRGGPPKWMVKIMVNPIKIKMDDLPLFLWKHPIRFPLIMANQPTPPNVPLVSLNKALLAPYYWGG